MNCTNSRPASPLWNHASIKWMRTFTARRLTNCGYRCGRLGNLMLAWADWLTEEC